LNLYKNHSDPHSASTKRTRFSYPTPLIPLDPPWSLRLLGWLEKVELCLVDQKHLSVPFSGKNMISHDILGVPKLNFQASFLPFDRTFSGTS